MTRTALQAEDGLVATQLAVLMPAILLLVMLAVQFALWMHATQLADSAADQAVTTAAAPHATPDAARQAALGLLSQAGNLDDVTVTVDRDDQLATATVTGAAPHVVPGWRWHVAGHAAAPIERFRGQAGR